MKITPLPIPGAFAIRTGSVADARGRFTRVFCAQALAEARPGLVFVQANVSLTQRRGTVRGMHFQRPPGDEAKLIRCLRGRVFDVIVDLRPESPRHRQWHAVELSGDGDLEVLVPEGCAHGFQALEDDTELLYMHTAPWTPSLEGRLNPLDPALAIAWPLPVAMMSDADAAAPMLADRPGSVP